MFTPHTDSEKREMLQAIGVKDIGDLFNDIPSVYRFPKLDLPPALTEMEVLEELKELAAANNATDELSCFLGAGAYDHYIPAAIDSLIRRSEFYTSYTPYQPEISQGTLQAIFEYQSLIAALTGMEIANASHYDGATAATEAVIMAYNHFRGKRPKVVLSPALHPQYRAVLRTYTQGNQKIIFLGDEAGNILGTYPSHLNSLIDQQTALVILQYPDFLGRIVDYSSLVQTAHQAGALVAMAVNPIALGMFKTPGELGADIVVGEGQPLGMPLNFGGPYLGIFATRKELVRKISGRLVGETTDTKGKRAYVLTLTAREQHIRREKATSNICTNQGLLALTAAVYLSLLGKHGLRQVAELCYHKAHYAARLINQLPEYHVAFEDPFFNEFVVRCPRPVGDINADLLDRGILGGYDLSKDYPDLDNHMLIAVTEKNSRDQIDEFCLALEEVSFA
jgi:glycine dehydrogenase subunit 1